MQSSSPVKNFSLRCERVVTPERVLENVVVAIENDRIARISPKSDAGFEGMDLSGTTLLPGMIDVHIHGAVGVDTMNTGPSDLDQVSRFLATYGVTGWLPTLVPAPAGDYKKAITAIESAMREQERGPVTHGARVLGVHYEGPFVNSAQCGALHANHFKSFASVADIEVLPTPKPEAIRMMTLAPEVEGGIALTGELVRRGWIVSLGHTRASVADLEQAFAAGAHHLTHFMNAMAPFHHRAPGPIGWGLTRDDVTVDVIADGIHLDPFVLKLILQAKGTRQLTLISDAIAATGQGDGEYQIWGETISVKAGRTSNANGNIAGSVITMHDAARLMRTLGASDVDVAWMTAANPARLLGIEDQCGSIAVGKRADLIAIDKSGNVCLTIIGGQVVHQV